MPAPSQTTDVLVIGAGISGVTTASTLRENGIKSIVLEAQDRIGGRILTSRKWKNLPCDMGAGWVSHPSINPLYEVARKNKIELIDSNLGNLSVIEAGGYSLTNDEIVVLFGLYGFAYLNVKKEAEHRRNRGKGDVALSKVLPGVIAGMASDLDLDLRTQQAIEFMWNMSVAEAYATDYKDLSLFNWDDNYTEAFLSTSIVPDGYVRIVEALAKGLDIRKEHVASDISYDEKGVSVCTDRGDFRADFVVVTVPHGVLAKKPCPIKFHPQLPKWKQAAIDHVHTGLSDKFWFHFPSKFWKSNRDAMGRIDPTGKGEWSTWLNFHKYTGEPLLLVFNRTAHAKKLEKMSDKAVIAEAMDVLRKEFPHKKVPDPIDMQRSGWGMNEFAGGTISHLPKGASKEDYRALGAPVGRLRFAGDSTCPEFNLQVIGAFWSGIREAERLTCDYLFSTYCDTRSRKTSGTRTG